MGFVAGARSLGEEAIVDKVMGFGKSYLLEKALPGCEGQIWA